HAKLRSAGPHRTGARERVQEAAAGPKALAGACESGQLVNQPGQKSKIWSVVRVTSGNFLEMYWCFSLRSCRWMCVRPGFLSRTAWQRGFLEVLRQQFALT